MGAEKIVLCHLPGSAVPLNRDNVGSHFLFPKCWTCSEYRLPPLTTALLSLMKYLFETPFPFDFFACILMRRDRGIADC